MENIQIGNQNFREDEIQFGNALLKYLPKNWKVIFNWNYGLEGYDVKYLIFQKRKEILVDYNQNLHYWLSSILPEFKDKLKKLKVIN